MLAAKALVFAAWPWWWARSWASWLSSSARPDLGKAPTASLGDPGVLRAVLGAGLYLVALAVDLVGLGAMVRKTAGGIAIIVAFMFVLPAVDPALPDSWGHPIEKYWPTQAGSQIASVHVAAHSLQPWPGFGVMCLFVAIVYAIAWTLLDAGTHDGGPGRVAASSGQRAAGSGQRTVPRAVQGLWRSSR